MTILGPATPDQRELLKQLIHNEGGRLIDEATLDRFIDAGEIRKYAQGEAITAEGDMDPDVYILMEGILRSWHWDGDVEKTAYFGMPGTLCISYHSYLMGVPSPSWHEACCSSTVFRISKRDFDGFRDTSHCFTKWLLSNAQFQLYFFEVKWNVIQGTARQRYESLMRNRPEIFRNVQLKTIASYLGVTPQYLSKLRRSLSN